MLDTSPLRRLRDAGLVVIRGQNLELGGFSFTALTASGIAALWATRRAYSIHHKNPGPTGQA